MWLKIKHVSTCNFGNSMSNLKKLFHATCQEARLIIWLQLLVGLLPKIWKGKKRPKFGTI